MISAIIADDEPIVRRTVRAIGQWAENGVELVGEAENGIEALEMITQKKADLAFIDMRMPGLSGTELLKCLDKRGIAIAVVVISGYDQFEYAISALKYGALDYILKPIDRKKFNETLRKVCQRIRNSENFDDTVDLAKNTNTLMCIRERIQKDFALDISLNSLAQEFYHNKEALSRAYKKKFGIGITNDITAVRLKKSKEMLLAGYSVSQTSEMVGFGAASYFSRVFKRTYGMTPSEYVDTALRDKE